MAYFQRLMGLNTQILLAAMVGIGLGFWLNPLAADHELKIQILYWAGILGSLFIGLLKMVVMPLIFTSLVVGIAKLQQHRQAGAVWRYTLGFFLFTMLLAMALALLITGWVKPGQGLDIALFSGAMSSVQAQTLSGGEFLSQLLKSLFQNPVAAMADGKILPLVVFAIFLGVALVKASVGEESRRFQLLGVLEELLDLLMRIIGWIMRIAPLGVLGLLTKLMATQDMALLTTVAEFIVLVFGITLIHGVVVLPGLLYLLTGKSPLWLWRGAREALVTAFATSSSAATLPVTLRCAEHNLGVRKDVAGFVLPVGATMNMDGTALYEASAALFIAYLLGMDLSLGQQLVVMATAMVASMGAPGIPSAGMVTMVMVLQAVGLPAEAIAILLPIDRILDTIRTAVNVEGDIVTSVVVDSRLKHEA